MTRIAEQDEPADAPESAQPNYVGLNIDDRYHVLKTIGSGGMGTVVLARHLGLKRLVAIKFLERAEVSESGATQRLFREAQAAAAIGHPNIIEVLDVGAAPWGAPYLVMEYLDGEDLATLTEREGNLSVAETCWVLERVLLGLAAAHETGVVHRDVKPQNIVLARRRSELTIKIIDFGIAKVSEPGLTPLTRSGELVGTPSFMSPEQAKGEDVDARSDIFSVGLLFHRLVAGKNPFSGANYHSLLHRIATGEPELATGLLPPDVRTFIERCLEKDPAKRFQNVKEALAQMSELEAWSTRTEAVITLERKLRSTDTQPDTIVERSWTPSHERQPPKISHVTERSPLPDLNQQLEPTLAVSTSSSEALRPSPPPWQRWWPVGLLLLAAFGGGWWASNWAPGGPSAAPVSSSSHRTPEPDLQIGKSAVVKLYPATETPAASVGSAVSVANEPAATLNRHMTLAVKPGSTPNAAPPTPVDPLGVAPNQGPSNVVSPSRGLSDGVLLGGAQHGAPAPSGVTVNGNVTANTDAPAHTDVAADTAPTPKGANSLGVAGKNSFFSEVFE